jgi:translation initiation factor 1
MNQACQKCGLPLELCVCEVIAKEAQKIKVRIEKRKFGKKYTIIEGITDKNINLKDIVKQLKSLLACGGAVDKETGMIELQGEHSRRVKEHLIKLGFADEQIEVR